MKEQKTMTESKDYGWKRFPEDGYPKIPGGRGCSEELDVAFDDGTTERGVHFGWDVQTGICLFPEPKTGKPTWFQQGLTVFGASNVEETPQPRKVTWFRDAKPVEHPEKQGAIGSRVHVNAYVDDRLRLLVTNVYADGKRHCRAESFLDLAAKTNDQAVATSAFYNACVSTMRRQIKHAVQSWAKAAGCSEETLLEHTVPSLECRFDGTTLHVAVRPVPRADAHKHGYALKL